MIGEGIQEEVLRALVQQHAVREVVVGRINGDPAWGRSGRTLGAGALAATSAMHVGQPDKPDSRRQIRRPARPQGLYRQAMSG